MTSGCRFVHLGSLRNIEAFAAYVREQGLTIPCDLEILLEGGIAGRSAYSMGAVSSRKPFNEDLARERNELSDAGIGAACRWISTNRNVFAFGPEIHGARPEDQSCM